MEANDHAIDLSSCAICGTHFQKRLSQLIRHVLRKSKGDCMAYYAEYLGTLEVQEILRADAGAQHAQDEDGYHSASESSEEGQAQDKGGGGREEAEEKEDDQDEDEEGEEEEDAEDDEQYWHDCLEIEGDRYQDTSDSEKSSNEDEGGREDQTGPNQSASSTFHGIQAGELTTANELSSVVFLDDVVAAAERELANQLPKTCPARVNQYKSRYVHYTYIHIYIYS
jgi:hypothetical protein